MIIAVIYRTKATLKLKLTYKKYMISDLFICTDVAHLIIKLGWIFFHSSPKNREELTETRESLQQMKEKLVGQEESFRKKCIDLDADVLSLRKANAELEVMTRAGHSGYCSWISNGYPDENPVTNIQEKILHVSKRTFLCFYEILYSATSVDLSSGFNILKLF